MRNFIISPEAREDLLAIQDYIARDNRAAASVVIDAVFAACGELSEYPMMGHCRNDLTSRNVRFWSVYSYLIVYDATSKPISIVRVLSGYRDIANLLQQH